MHKYPVITMVDYTETVFGVRNAVDIYRIFSVPDPKNSFCVINQ